MPASIRTPRFRATGKSSSVRIARRATSTATKLNVLTTKHGPTPATAITIPASAGPTTREALSKPELSATAFGSSFGPTISNVSDCRPGASSTSVIPPSRASA